MQEHWHYPLIALVSAKLWRTSSSSLGVCLRWLPEQGCQAWLECYRSDEVRGLASATSAGPSGLGRPRELWPRAAGETRDGAGQHASPPHVMCMSVQTVSSLLLHFFSGAACGPLWSSSACPNDAWQTADPLSLLSNRLYPPYCMLVTWLLL